MPNIRRYLPSCRLVSALFSAGIVLSLGKLEVFKCPFLGVLNLPCPGCGMSRGFWSVVSLNWSQAWNYNPASYGIFLVAISVTYRDVFIHQISHVIHRAIMLIVITAIIAVWTYRINLVCF